MYIPPYHNELTVLKRRGVAPDGYAAWIPWSGFPAVPGSFVQWVFDQGREVLDGNLGVLRKRSATSTNALIGLIVGLLLAAFVIGVLVFLYFYGQSLRVAYKKQRHRRRSTSSKGSRSSKQSREGDHPPEPVPAEGQATE